MSVVIPVHNAERYLAEAIGSVLAQTAPPAQVIVVDDGSTDGSAAVARRFEPFVEYVWQPNRGCAAARNRGVRESRAKYLAFLDADDLWMPQKLERQLAVLAEASQVDMVFGLAQQFVSSDVREQGHGTELSGNPIPMYLPPAMLISRDTFLRVGLYREDLKLGDGIDWYARAVDLALRSKLLPEVVYRRRLHDTNLGITGVSNRSDYVHVIRDVLARRRSLSSSTPS